MPKPSKQIIIDAIITEIEKGRVYTKVLASIGGKWRIASRTFDRYWKIANEQHTAKQQAIKTKLAIVDEQAAIEARKSGLKSKLEVQLWYQNEIEIMEKQLRGESKFPFALGNSIKNSHTGDLFMLPIQLQNELRNQIKSYQTEITKMEGDYAPTKIANTDSKGDDLADISEMATSKLIEYLDSRNNK